MSRSRPGKRKPTVARKALPARPSLTVWPPGDRRWPKKPDPDVDDDQWVIADDAEPYEVYSPYGRVLGRFRDRDASILAMLQWPQAAYVLFAGEDLVASKGDDGLSLERRAA